MHVQVRQADDKIIWIAFYCLYISIYEKLETQVHKATRNISMIFTDAK